MRRFLITSPAYNGDAELHYDLTGRLVRIDVTHTDMPISIIPAFKTKVPAFIDGLQEAFTGTKATIVEADFEVTFEMFWNIYKKKINRSRALRLWDKLSKVEQVKAYYGVNDYDKYLKKEKWRSKADPETYLRNMMWENEWK